ncbi:lipase family protein [Streptomyces albireticuli]|uniref:Lipase n=1 Tax=Streptomyces albireticuli TaxID=1940 RepID=A0A2A2DAG7_9ACTN|nr:lipase family protein [Streptomyces albireticuli]MCD9144821.1 prolyl oligopeptidase family serine peptidase [Streptomyces albireticuli]MCD9165690.1 prolyl oligopeptidase family serine peptidase [Streptomyces albireticuli]MCD9193728.1 prolyl oligopeptidase family serine peptidase [Streptomyces albireticuli]PAU48426.1 lipase [Streptomyces albireticuli]
MRLRSIALTAVTALAVSLGASTASAGTRAEAAKSPGDIVSSAPTSFHPLPGQPTNTKAWHLTYRSTTAKGAPNVVSGTVIVPQDGRKGPRPLITYAVGTVGLGDQCAPSAGFPYGTTLEANLIQLLTLRGWAVAVTDYEGLGTPGEHTYTVGRSAGHAVLDAARAALRLPEAGLSEDAPVGIMGYSQGGQATSWAAELHDSYAPELNLKGTATGGVPADLLKTADYNNGGIGAGLVLMAAAGQNAAYPELGLDRYLNDRGRHFIALMRERCVGIEAAAGLFKKISDVTVRNPLYEADWQRVLRSSDLGRHAPDRPVYLYHGVIDELIPYETGKRLRADWCGKGATVQWKSLPLGEHVLGVITESVPAANWLADRFAGKPATGNCQA